MGDRRSKKSRDKQVKTRPQTPDTVEERADALSHQAMFIFSTVAIVGVFFFLIYFFMSGVSDKIIASRTTPVVAAEKTIPNHAESNLPGDGFANADRGFWEDAATTDVDDESDDSNDETEAKTDTENTDRSEMFITITEEPSIDAMVRETLMDGGEVSKKDIMERLESMDSSEFTAFINMFLANGSSGQTNDLKDSNGSFHMSLEEAYSEAERLYPGQIDGSKRLRLVQDINAIDYLYYVAEEGDTLLELSRAFTVSLGQLVEINGIADADTIHAGEILLFPIDTLQPEIAE